MATIRKRGEFQWEVQIRKKGFPKQSKTFFTKPEAEGWAAIIESEMVRGVFVSRTEAESTTLAEAIDRYSQEITIHKKGAAQEISRLQQLKAHSISTHFLSSIRGADMAAFRDERIKAGYAPASVVRDLATLSHIFTVVRREWGMESVVNPVQLIRRPTIKNERERRIKTAKVWFYNESTSDFSEEELDELDMLVRYSASVELPAIVTVAVEAAMRRSEILSLHRRDINSKIRVAHLSDTKNGSARDVPLSSKAVKALQRDVEHIDGRIFTMTQDAVSRAFNRALNRARRVYEEGVQQKLAAEGKSAEKTRKILADDTFLTDLHFHDLRHEATSRLADIYPLHELAKVTGHRDTRMLLRYYHPKAEELARKLD